jgi:hypothetical protein
MNEPNNKKNIDKIIKSPIFLILFISIIIIILYYIISPYQNCLRTSFSERQCISKTSW